MAMETYSSRVKKRKKFIFVYMCLEFYMSKMNKENCDFSRGFSILLKIPSPALNDLKIISYFR